MKLKNQTWFPILYMFVLTLLISSILIVFGIFTRQRVEDNTRIAFERAVLEVLPIDLPVKISASQIHQLYTQLIREPDSLSGTALRYVQADSLIAYALPIEGSGFWATIKGVIGIAVDRKTVTGIYFYEQNETPGLGGEIASKAFRSQFIGKELAMSQVPLEVRITTAPVDMNAVHAITGATQTSMRLGMFLNKELIAWQQTVIKKGE
jgi:Na+-transporting NADH:ubiquinone oxidoreductase subunit C